MEPSSVMENFGSPCAACRMHRKRCIENCIFAPYFPQSVSGDFHLVHKVFGKANLIKILKALNGEERDEAVRTMVMEAKERIKNPVGGCIAIIQDLQQQKIHLETQLVSAESRILELQLQNSLLRNTIDSYKMSLSMHGVTENDDGFAGMDSSYPQCDSLWDFSEIDAHI